jgi:hypothetical protein
MVLTSRRDGDQSNLGVPSLLQTNDLHRDDPERARIEHRDPRTQALRQSQDVPRLRDPIRRSSVVRDLVHVNRPVPQEGVEEGSIVVHFHGDDPVEHGDGCKPAEESGEDGTGEGARGEVVERAALVEPPLGTAVHQLVQASVAADPSGCERLRGGGEEDAAGGSASDGRKGDAVRRCTDPSEVEGHFGLGTGGRGDVA